MAIFPNGVPKNKRLFDLCLTALGLICLIPLLLLISLLVIILDGFPIFFSQIRPGLNNKPFKIYKFRTMTNVKSEEGSLMPDKDRITKLGKILRSSSLDELPEFINIIRGEMSLVGPRPLLIQYLERYSPEQARRHLVLPGITGWTQINGRNDLSWEEKFRLDIWYVDNWSLLLDIQILLKTPAAVLTRRGINQPGQATAEEFMGEKNSGIKGNGH